MKKPNYIQEKRLLDKRERKRIIRIHKNPVFQPYKINNLLKNHRELNCLTPNFRFLIKNGFPIIPKIERESIEIKGKFSFRTNYVQTLQTIKKIFELLYATEKELIISFDKCKEIDVAPLLMLKIIKKDYFRYAASQKNKYNDRRFIEKDIKYIKSKDNEVNKYLFANRILLKAEFERIGFIPHFTTELITGRKSTKKNFSFNRKGPVCKAMTGYIDDSLKVLGMALNDEGVNAFEKMIAEILGNAEDHSNMKEWYVLGITFTKNDMSKNEESVMVNLVIANFGTTIYEGIEATKIPNHKIYRQIEKQYNNIDSTFPFHKFTRENLFTLYALQQGISRRKFQKRSSGNGTIPFIQSFMDLSYDIPSNNLFSDLIILSGNTMIKCDKRYKPYQDPERGDKYRLSLNKEKSLKSLPDKKQLINLGEYFPGTLLSAKIYLNKENLKKSVKNEFEN